MTGVSKRLAWVEKRLGVSRSKLSEYAGRSRSWAGQVIRGDISDAAVPEPCLRGIAEKTGVSFAWLARGEGQPFPGQVDHEAVPYPDLADVIAIVRARKDLDESVRDMVVERLVAYGAEGDLGFDEWLRRASRLIKGVEALGSTDESERDKEVFD